MTSFLDFGARYWWSIVLPSLGLLALTGWLIYERPKAFIPTEDQGYLIVVLQTPDGTTREPTSRAARRVGQIAGELHGVRDVLILDGYNAVTAINQTNTATAFVILEEWHHRTTPELRAVGLAGELQAQAVRAGPRCEGGGPPAPADPGAELDRRLRLHDRGPRGQGRRGHGVSHRPVPRRRPAAARAGRRVHELLGPGPAASIRHRPDQGPAPRCRRLGRLQRPPGQPRCVLRQRLQPLRQDVEGPGPGRGPRAAPARGRLPAVRPEPQGGPGPPERPGPGHVHARPDRRAALQHVHLRQDHRPAGAGLQLGPGDRGDAGRGRRGPAGGLRVRVDRHDLSGAEDREHGDLHLRPVDRLRLPVHVGPVRELDPAAGDHPDGAAGDLRRHGRAVALRHAAGRLRADRPGDAHRAGDEERDPDRRVRRGADRETRDEHHRFGQGGGPAAAPADPDDLVRVRLRGPADGPGHRRRGLQPQLAGGRDRVRDRGQHGARPVRHPDLLRPRRAARRPPEATRGARTAWARRRGRRPGAQSPEAAFAEAVES